MARRSENSPVYEAFDRFLKTCILDDFSLLWSGERAWTAENVAKVKQWVVDTPILGDPSFEEKLLEQMKDAGPQHWMILGDVFFVYTLPSSFLKFGTKQGYIRWIAEQGGLAEPSHEDEIWEAQKAGYTRTSQQYHSKYGQFWVLLLFADHVKSLDDPESVLRDHHQLQGILDAQLEKIEKIDRAYDMRHAILYMAFPEEYERIISTDDKRKIVRFYSKRLALPVPGDMDDLGAIDAAIDKIRKALAREHDGEEPFDFYDDLKKEWRVGIPPPIADTNGDGMVRSKTPAEATFLLSLLARTRNVMLHGPPGTGKTYIAREAAEALISAQAEAASSESAALMDIIEGLSFYEVLALCMYLLGRESSHPVSDILDHGLVQARYQARPVQNPRANIWGALQSHTDPVSSTVNTLRRMSPYLFDKEETGGRWYLTAAGREYVEGDLSVPLKNLRGVQPTKPTSDRFVEWTTFHQSYAYEDFVEGLRPIQSEENPEGISYQVLPGAFRRICARAAADPKNKYILVIDEINRGNIAKILGELMTLLEDDKRAGEPNELAITLPYSGDAFSVPSNLYIIGTMNTADRSIALLDVALRRRFAFVEVMPTPTLLDDATVEYEGHVVHLGELLRTLNRAIVRSVDREHQIGHSYLLDVAKADGDDRVAMLEFAWNYQILPLLEEYFYSQREILAEFLAPFHVEDEANLLTDSNIDIDFDLARAAGDKLIFALSKLVETGQAP